LAEIEIQASIFVLPERNTSMPVRALWREIAKELSAELGERFFYDEAWGYRIVLKSEAMKSPDGRYVRYRTIEAAIRRGNSGKPTLLDLSVGNMFALAGAFPPAPLHLVKVGALALWARKAGQIKLDDYVRLIGMFADDLLDIGWYLEKPKLNAVTYASPIVINGRGAQPLPTGKFHALAKHPYSWPQSPLAFSVVWPETNEAAWSVEKLGRALAEVFPSSGKDCYPVSALRRLSSSAVNLVIVDDHCDLNEHAPLREMLREAEAAGVKFKLARLASLGMSYSACNIAYDLFLIGGGRPWVPSKDQPAFCALDAGHDIERDRSRWVKVETNHEQKIARVRVFDTTLAEHIPTELVSDMWPSDRTAILCRDGRLTQERLRMEARAAKDGLALIEAKKSPRAIIWRATKIGLRPAEFGDGVIDEHDELLLQTVPQNVRDYVRPIRISARGSDLVEMGAAFLHQQAMPGLSLYAMARLPGALYFADLVSKLTSDGWTKAVGRGFNIPQVIP
jgi:hypothetical protein